jgi:hypothetical protein
VNITKAGSGRDKGTVTSSPAGINCGTGPGCSHSFPVFPPATVTLTAVAGPNNVFKGWSGVIGCPGTGPCTWTMQENTLYNIAATFLLTTPPPPPNTTLFKKPAKTTKKKTASFYWGATLNGSVLSSFKSQCKLDKQKAWKACKSGVTYRKLRVGTHTFRVRAGNANGWDKTPVVYSWKVKK